MMLSWFRMLALGSLLIWLNPVGSLAQEPTASGTPQVPPPPEVSQPAYDVLRVDDNGIEVIDVALLDSAEQPRHSRSSCL